MHWDPANYKHQELTEAIIHDFYEVYNELGHGFLESVYARSTIPGVESKRSQRAAAISSAGLVSRRSDW